MNRHQLTVEDCTGTDFSTYDAIILDHNALDRFLDTIGGLTAVPDSTAVFTDDEHTSNTVEFNLIMFNNDSTYDTATQLHHPFATDDFILDLRNPPHSSFADYLLGLR